MSTFIYAPGIKVFIDTERHGIVDVSEDIRDGSISIGEDRPSSFTVSLLNHRRKYDGVFTPNDRIHVQLKRVNWLPIFSGYLDEVPFFSIYPRTVVIKATCTLKRLKRTYWDSGSHAAMMLLNHSSDRGENDGGLRDRVVALLTEVADWPEGNIHIGAIPSDWVEQTRDLQSLLGSRIGGMGSTMHGHSPTEGGTLQIHSDIPGTGVLPVENGRGKIVVVGNVNRELELTQPEHGGPGAPGTDTGYRDDWYVHMRFPYRTSRQDTHLSPEDFAAAKTWWKEQKILVVNPKNNRGVVLRPVDWGPVNASMDVGVSEMAMNVVLKAERGDVMDVRFTNPNSRLGPVPTTETGAGRDGASGRSVATRDPQTAEVVAASGLRWTSADNLRPHVAAARDFIRQNWGEELRTIGGYAKRNVQGTSKPSDHSLGLALDCMVSNGEPNTRQIQIGNEIAQWFIANPDAFGTRMVIWRDRSNNGKGWNPYRHPAATIRGDGRATDPTLGHRNHPHISFKNENRTSVQPMGNPMVGYNDPFLADTTGAASPMVTGGGFGPFEGSGPSLINVGNWWTIDASTLSRGLTGARRLLNDKPLYPTVSELMQVAMRKHMSAPNGDFIGWFPDYFGVYGTAGIMEVHDIEIANLGFTIQWSDENLITHQFTAGASVGLQTDSAPTGGVIDRIVNPVQTSGIASVEFPELMEMLFNVSADDPRSELFRNAETILNRHGVRVDYKPISTITGSDAEFWYAVHLFQQSWAKQFSSSVQLTFMPEIWPGMLLRFASLGLQVYVTAVNHQFSFTGGFSTSVTVMAPSATDKSGLYGLPRAGGQPAPSTGMSGGAGGRNLHL